MFKKHKEKKQAAVQARNDSQLQVELELEKGLQDALKVEDPAERLLRLQDAAKAARFAASDLESENRGESLKADLTVGGTSAMGGIVALGVGAVLVPPVMLAAVPLMFGGLFAGEARGKAVGRKLEERDGTHIENCRAIGDRAYEAIDLTIEQNVTGISQSPFYEQALENMYIAKIFSKAAAKQVVADQQALAEAATADKPEADAVAVEAPVESAPPEKQDFTRFTQFGRDTPKKGPKV